ncbi:hypothetical protein BE17_53340 [Sorangium cellulosum]|uniref:Uncharacterized protein n=1 Tax=Sorangium cellulosum TaxID=56 RepID=A0A150RDF7_SORCE|nr:hypothetical protein BE17_53340 [Sorangium cellulosum]
MAEPHRDSGTQGIQGILARPYIDLEPYLDLSPLAEIHEEICLALTQVPIDYTGGSHRTMGIMPPSRRGEALADYGEVIRGLSDEEFLTFQRLSDGPAAIDRSSRATLEFGEERELPLSRRQMLWLKFRHGVYFPWKVYVELIPNRYWSDKSRSEGKDFTRLARSFFPRTIAYVKRLPFSSIGRCNIMGLEANDHGTVHRDGDGEQGEGAEEGERALRESTRREPDHFITLCPAGNKRLFLWDEQARRKTPVAGRAYWFNDHDYHGVEADPFFRYSLRIDGTFTPEFIEALRRDHGAPSARPAPSPPAPRDAGEAAA